MMIMMKKTQNSNSTSENEMPIKIITNKVVVLKLKSAFNNTLSDS